MERIYLDYGATSPMRSEAIEAMIPFLKSEFGNSGSIHDLGQRANDAIQMARSQIMHALGAETPREIVFTSSGTEANNLAILGFARKHRQKGTHIITTQIEHPSILEACHFLEKEGFTVTYLPVDSTGMVTVQEVQNALTDQTILVSIMAANNEVGTIQPISEIGKVLKNHQAYFHTDAIQFFGKIPVCVKELGVDLLSIGSHKIYGPKGVGALYIRKGVRIEPLLHGGGQERAIRPSTLNTPAIVSFGVAAQLVAEEVKEEAKRLTKLREYTWYRIRQEIGDVELNGHPTNRLPNNLNLSFQRVEGQAILLELNREQIYVSSGSACSAGKHRASHVLQAMGKREEIAYQSVRITLGKETDQTQIDRFIDVLKQALHYLRMLI
ncbi:cysteine desulfurase family protein [Risungbinella massiliensis]|uniref:cysteine desulfurase family protein n=1 Tax=Risungbinella massiliensis TaxID=1329796 RepID=UPI0005CC55F9|nr:cysteine desulfurase family protein [Risungbinella massiliensis]